MDMKHLLNKLDSIGQKKTKVESTGDMKKFVSIVKDFSKPKKRGVAEGSLNEFLPALAVGALARGAAVGAKAVGGAALKGARAVAPKITRVGQQIGKVPGQIEKGLIKGFEVLDALVPGGIFNPDGTMKGSQYLSKYLTPQQIQLVQQHEKTNASLNKNQGVAESEQSMSVQQLATVSDEALDKAYGYGRSSPGNTFGWQANLKSAEFAKRMIDSGETDIEKISDAIHKGWNVTAQEFVKNPDHFDDTEKLRAAGKLDAKLQQRAKLMKISYSELPDDEKEKDRVVARALLQAIKGDNKEESLGEGLSFKDYLNLAEAKKKITAKEDPCWKGYKMVGTKKKGGREVPNCVPGKKGD